MRAAIIGAGHNGLVCANYLARQGLDVTVFERRNSVGGLCVTEELFPGFQVSSVASYYGMMRKEIVDELELEKFGMRPYLADPVEIVLVPDGGYIFTPRDGSDTTYKVGGVTAEDIDGWKRFWSDIGQAAHLLYPFYFRRNVSQQDLESFLKAAKLEHVSKLLFKGTLLDLLKEYLSNETLMAVASTCTPGFSNKVGSVFGCIHHGTARTCGHFGAWGFVKGGMGAVTKAMASSAVQHGVRLKTATPIKRILVKNGTAYGVELHDGTTENYDFIVSNADPETTYTKLLDHSLIPADLKSDVEGIQNKLSAGKVHFALKGLPPFPTLDKIKHNYGGVIVIAPELAAVISASRSVPEGQMPEQLMMTMAFPSVMDSDAAPSGKHLLTVDVHYLPVTCNGQPWSESNRKVLIDAVVTGIEKHAPGFAEYIDDVAAITPGDLANKYGVSTASCWHLPMTSEFLFERRRLGGTDDYETPIKHLFLCGAGTHPSGNVTGAPGYNCAERILGYVSILATRLTR